MRDYHRSPWFFILFSCFGAGYVVADDNRIDRETQQPTQVSQHYQECTK